MQYVIRLKNRKGKTLSLIAKNDCELEKLLTRHWRIRATALIYQVDETPGKARALAVPGLWEVKDAYKTTSGLVGVFDI
jgi:hypothetical protein